MQITIRPFSARVKILVSRSILERVLKIPIKHIPSVSRVKTAKIISSSHICDRIRLESFLYLHTIRSQHDITP